MYFFAYISQADMKLEGLLTVRDMTRAPEGGINPSGIRNIFPPRPPSFFHLLPPYLLFTRSPISLANSMWAIWSSPTGTKSACNNRAQFPFTFGMIRLIVLDPLLCLCICSRYLYIQASSSAVYCLEEIIDRGGHLVQEDVSCHEDRVGEQPSANFLTLPGYNSQSLELL